MHAKDGRSQHRRIAKRLLISGVVLFFTFILFPLTVNAQQYHQLADGPTILSVKAGFNGDYRVGNWIPIQVEVKNNGGQFDGTISISLSTSYAGNYPSLINTSVYQTAISLPALSQKQITMYTPVDNVENGPDTPDKLTVHLQDNNNHEVASQSIGITSVAGSELYIGLISDQSLDVRQFAGALSGQNARTYVETLGSAQDSIPTAPLVLNNFDLLVLDNATTSTLSKDQLTALQSWVNQGGALVEVGGPEWHNTLGSLPTSLLPVTITGTDTLAAGQHLLPQNGAGQGQGTDDTLSTSVPVSVATPTPGSLVLLASNNIPLIVQANIGQGSVYYLAYDPFLDPLVNWANTSDLWTNLLLRTSGGQLATTNAYNSPHPSQVASKYSLYGSMNNFIESLIPNAFPSIWLILTLLISYLLILGPLRFVLIRWLKKKAWSWRIVVATIVLFSLLSYGLALQVKGTSVVSSKVSVLQLSQTDSAGSQAHVTDYIGVYVPNQGDFHVYIPGTRLVEATDQFSSYGPYGYGPYGPYGPSGISTQSTSHQTTVTTQASSTDVNLQGVDSWTLRTLETTYDTHLQGGITSNLSFSQSTVTGTVTNTLPYTLNDAYLLVGDDYQPLGTLASKQTKSVELTTQAQTNNKNYYGVPSPLANQIAGSNENHRYTALLQTLTGNCNMMPCNQTNYGGPIPMKGGPPFQSNLLQGPRSSYSQDPLLMAGAPATLIGWIDNSSDTTNITINNGTVPSTQETLLQAPLNLHFTGTVDVPAALSTGRIVDVQGLNGNSSPQATGSGFYSLTTGSITFEIQLPVTGNLQNGETTPTLTFNEAATGTSPYTTYSYQSTGPTNGANTMSIGLYNWQANTWDSETFKATTFKVDNAQPYIDSNGRVLIRFANGQNSQTPTVFSMPSVELKATIAG